MVLAYQLMLTSVGISRQVSKHSDLPVNCPSCQSLQLKTRLRQPGSSQYMSLTIQNKGVSSSLLFEPQILQTSMICDSLSSPDLQTVMRLQSTATRAETPSSLPHMHGKPVVSFICTPFAVQLNLFVQLTLRASFCPTMPCDTSRASKVSSSPRPRI